MTDIPPHVQVLRMILGQWVSAAVSAVARLGIADHLRDGPQTTDALAVAVGARPDLLYRLLRATSSVGIFAEDADGRFAQTPMSDVLRSDAVPTLRHVAMFNNDEWHVRGWAHLAETVMRGERVIERLYGRPLFEYFDQDREAGRTFHQGMTDLSTLDAPAIVDAYDFSGFGSVTDVGGGHGLLIATILGRHPHLRGMLYDRPEVVAGAAGGPLDAVRDRLETLGGDMFESVPAGADAYIMKYIIHDWPDDVSERILRHCRDGVNPGGRLLVVDSVVPEGPDFSFPKIADLEMMLFPGGKERTEAEFGRLFSAAGWQLQRIVPTASHVSIVEGIPA